jgi:hypothetical protein
MTRLFRDGRTETVRSCSIESSQWVKSMEDTSASVRYLLNNDNMAHVSFSFSFFGLLSILEI